MVQHAAITDPNIHESKGVAGAAGNTVYVASGTGTGSWKKIDTTALKGLAGDAGSTNKTPVSDGSNGFVFRDSADYGTMNITNNTNNFAIGTASDGTLQTNSDYVALTGTGAPWASDVLLGSAFSVNNLSAPVTGLYQWLFWANIHGFPTTTALIGAKWKTSTGVFSPRSIIARSQVAADIQQLVGHDLIQLNAGDTVQIVVASSAAGNLVIKHAQMQLVLLRQTA